MGRATDLAVGGSYPRGVEPSLEVAVAALGLLRIRFVFLGGCEHVILTRVRYLLLLLLGHFLLHRRLHGMPFHSDLVGWM